MSRMRADARRNRDRILDVARRLFEERGPTVEMDDVARKADVGVGTVYRHFATKDALIEGVLASHVAKLVEAAANCANARDAGRAFFEFLEILAAELLVRGRLHRAVADARSRYVAKERDLLQANLAKALARAQTAGAIRDDVGVAEIIVLLRGALLPIGEEDVSERVRRRAFDVICNGLRP